MKTPFLLPLLLLVGCAGPVGDRSFVVEKTPAAAIAESLDIYFTRHFGMKLK